MDSNVNIVTTSSNQKLESKKNAFNHHLTLSSPREKIVFVSDDENDHKQQQQRKNRNIVVSSTIDSIETISSLVIPFSRKLSPTEQRNEKSIHLATMPLDKVIELMVDEESFALRQILTQRHQLQELINKMSTCLNDGGRVFYVGAGTSGRLGMMDAIECHSTFSTSVDSVQGVVAGGIRALHEPFDCAEETFDDGLAVIKNKTLTKNDVVVGISASGQTPFLWGSLYQAKLSGSFVSLITFNPFLEFRPICRPDLTITIAVGPEVLTGSTRLKCGTATKTILNMLSTLTMVKIGKCYQNLMINLIPSNSKLRDRSVRIVSSLLPDVEVDVVRNVLIQHEYDIKKSIDHLMKQRNHHSS